MVPCEVRFVRTGLDPGAVIVRVRDLVVAAKIVAEERYAEKVEVWFGVVNRAWDILGMASTRVVSNDQANGPSITRLRDERIGGTDADFLGR